MKKSESDQGFLLNIKENLTERQSNVRQDTPSCPSPSFVSLFIFNIFSFLLRPYMISSAFCHSRSPISIIHPYMPAHCDLRQRPACEVGHGNYPGPPRGLRAYLLPITLFVDALHVNHKTRIW